MSRSLAVRLRKVRVMEAMRCEGYRSCAQSHTFASMSVSARLLPLASYEAKRMLIEPLSRLVTSGGRRAYHTSPCPSISNTDANACCVIAS